MASPRVGSPITSCQCSTGIWLVTMVEARPWRSSRISSRSRRSGRIENRQTPIIENEELNAPEGFEHAAIAAVAPSQGEGLEQARDAMILDRTIVAARLVAEGAGNPTLAEPGRDSVTNAGCPAFEVLILYPFHPRAGQMVQVEHRKRFAGEDHLVVVQPDGTLALIPAWMSEDIARSATLTASPRLAVERLVELPGANRCAYRLSRRGMAPA